MKPEHLAEDLGIAELPLHPAELSELITKILPIANI